MAEFISSPRSRLVWLLVLSLHAGVGALLMIGSRAVLIPAPYSLQLLLLPPASAPTVRYDSARPRRVITNVAHPAALAVASVAAGPASAPDGSGRLVDWTAEAHRALRSFEIRRDRIPDSAQSVSWPIDDWWRREHHVGEQYKTERGDWIVWISARCYQIASWRSDSAESEGAAPETICTARGDRPRPD